MLNFILILSAIYIVILPFLMFYLVVKLIGTVKDEEIEVLPKILPKKKKKKVEISAEEQKIMNIIANIDAYDGTSNGQKPIKE